MKKSTEITNKELDVETRYSLGFTKKEKDNLSKTQLLLKDRARSAKPLLLRKYIPKLKPVKADLNPTIIYLGGKDGYFNYKKYREDLFRNINDINIVNEEDSEKNANSGDERYNINDKNISISSGDDNENNENDEKCNNINIDIKIPKNKKYVKNNINSLRKSLMRTKEKTKLKKYKDDTSIVSNVTYKNYFLENYGYRWENKRYLINNENLSNTSFDYSFDNLYRRKSKTIYAEGNKLRNRPPILGFLKVNENSINTTLSSGISEM